MLLHANLVPQSEMFLNQWFKPAKHNKWFYYKPLEKPIISIKKDSEIIKTLDPALRDLFMQITFKGYKTLPSCSGHFHSEKEKREKYLYILKDLIEIKNKGLDLKNVETEKKYRYRNYFYQKPWKSYQEFKNILEENMSVGYIGIIKPLNNINLQTGQIEIYTNSKYFGIPVMHIKINNQNQQDIERNWKIVSEILFDTI